MKEFMNRRFALGTILTFVFACVVIPFQALFAGLFKRKIQDAIITPYTVHEYEIVFRRVPSQADKLYQQRTNKAYWKWHDAVYEVRKGGKVISSAHRTEGESHIETLLEAVGKAQIDINYDNARHLASYLRGVWDAHNPQHAVSLSGAIV